MPLAHHDGKSIFFAHVPKTGGSSVEDYLISRFGPLSLIDVNKRRGLRGTGLIVPATHLAAIDIAELVPHDLAYSFAVVRDPMSRLMSEFRYQSGVSRMSRLGFSTWLRIMLGAVTREPRLYENHIRPQSDLVPEDADVFRLEDGFDAMIAALDRVTGTERPDLIVPHINTRKKDPITISQEDAALIERVYAADYDRFGYQPPNQADLPSDGRSGLRSAFAAPLIRALVLKQRHDWAR